VVTFAVSKDVHTPFILFYHVDLGNGVVTPVVDFKNLADPEAYFEPAPGTNIPLRYYSPWTGSMSPKGDKLPVSDPRSHRAADRCCRAERFTAHRFCRRGTPIQLHRIRRSQDESPV
jgi:hypothetical protein